MKAPPSLCQDGRGSEAASGDRPKTADSGQTCNTLSVVWIAYQHDQGTIELTKNFKNHSRTKHIDIRYHFVKERVQSNEIVLAYCQTSKMIADMITKSLSLFEGY